MPKFCGLFVFATLLLPAFIQIMIFYYCSSRVRAPTRMQICMNWRPTVLCTTVPLGVRANALVPLSAPNEASYVPWATASAPVAPPLSPGTHGCVAPETRRRSTRHASERAKGPLDPGRSATRSLAHGWIPQTANIDANIDASAHLAVRCRPCQVRRGLIYGERPRNFLDIYFPPEDKAPAKADSGNGDAGGKARRPASVQSPPPTVPAATVLTRSPPCSLLSLASDLK